MKYTPVLMLPFLFFMQNEAAAQGRRLAIHSYATRPDNAETNKGKYAMNQFIGRWQEMERIKSKSKERAEVVDTLYIRFYKNNTAETKEGNSLVITGTSEVFTDNYITTSAADFRIVSVEPNVIVLDDLMGYQHKLFRTKRFAYEASNNPPAVQADIADNKVELNSASLIKNWFAYRRSANPGFVKGGTPLIRNLRIREKLSENSYKGEVEFARNGEAYVQPCTLVFTGKMLSIETEGSRWEMQVYKADGQEMIVGKKGELVYYFKHLDQ